MQPEVLKYLYDIKVAADKIQRFTASHDEAAYLADELVQSATERQFEIIGEAAGKLSKLDPVTARQLPEYRKMISFRNILIHGYASVDPLIVWGVVDSDLARLLERVEALLSGY